jgi:hypothetical protein
MTVPRCGACKKVLIAEFDGCPTCRTRQLKNQDHLIPLAALQAQRTREIDQLEEVT